MDELTLLRRLDADTPAPSREAVTSAFDALTDRMAAAEAHLVPRRSRAKRLRRTALAIVGATALVAGLVLTDTIGVAGLRPGASAEAAELLDHAADTAIRTDDPVVHPGQYLVIRTDAVELASSGGWNGRDLRWQTHSVDTMYVPYDRQDNWVLQRTPREPVRFFSAEAKTRALLQWEETRARYDGRDELLRAREGDFYGSPADEVGFADLPRDPRVLLNRIYRTTLGQGQSPDGEALDWIAAQLRTGVVPANVRAALLRAAALIPDVAVTDGQAVLDGRVGVAIGRVEASSGVLQEIVIDRATGLLIGERSVATREIEGIPAGKVVESTAVTTTVVDQAPRGPEHRVD